MNWFLNTLISPVKTDTAQPNQTNLCSQRLIVNKSIANNAFICASELHIDERGVDLLIFTRIRDILRKWSYPESYWSIQQVKQHLFCDECSTIINDHRYINPISTLTGIYKCSLIQMLEINCDKDLHPDLGVSYHDVVRNKANVYISFPYTINYFSLVEALETFVKKHKDNSNSFSFWFELFNINFWDFKLEYNNILKAKNIIFSSEYLLSIIDNWENPSVTKRIWMLFELYCAAVANIKIKFTCSRAEMKYFKVNCIFTSTLEIADLSSLKAHNFQDITNISIFLKREGIKNTKISIKRAIKKAIKLLKYDLNMNINPITATIIGIEIESPVKPKYKNIIKLNKMVKYQDKTSVEPSNSSQHYHEQIEKIHKLYEEVV